MSERRYALIGHTHEGGPSSVAWGAITGTLSSQSDLQSALDLKATTSSLNISNWDTAFGWGNHASAGYITAAGALQNVVEDTTPQLGGQLDLNNFDISDPGTFWLKTGGSVIIGNAGLDSFFQVSSAGASVTEGRYLRVYNATGSDYGAFTHDGTDFNTALTNTTDWNITGLTTLAVTGIIDANPATDSWAVRWNHNGSRRGGFYVDANYQYWLNSAGSNVARNAVGTADVRFFGELQASKGVAAGLASAERGVLYAYSDNTTAPLNDEGLAPGLLWMEGRAAYANWNIQPYTDNLRFWSSSNSVTDPSMTVTSAGVLTTKDGFTSTKGNTAMQDLVDDTSPQLGADLGLNGFRIADTNHGRSGGHALTDYTTEQSWSDALVGTHEMVRNTVGTANGAPVDNYGYFTKIANRDGAGGWGGLWVGYAADQNYVGRTATSASYCTWEKIITTSTPNYAQWNTAYGWGDHAGLYQPLDSDLTAIAALSRTDGNFIVGNSSTWVAESGNTARTSLGLGTGDSPQFSTVNIGAATDTTLERASAGKLEVENRAIYANESTGYESGRIHFSTSAPTGGDGSNGDIWFEYTT